MPIQFLRIHTISESIDHLPILPKDWLKEVEQKWLKKEWSQWDNLHYDICSKICNNVYKNHTYWEKDQTHSDFLSELTRAQRAYFVLINFESQVHNGGVYQFLANSPELSILALEAMNEVGMTNLSREYQEVLIEYFGTYESFEELNARFQKDDQSWEDRWALFAEGYEVLQSATRIDAHFQKENFIKEFQSQLIKYVNENASGLFRIL